MVKTTDKPIVIQEEIDKAMEAEFDKLIKESKSNILLKLIIDRKIDSMSVDEIKELL